MISIPNFEYLPTIPATEENAQSIQALTLQDLQAGTFKDPLELADPTNETKVETQRMKLILNPNQYTGYADEDGQLVAYMKTNEWRTGDEAPYVGNFLTAPFARIALKKAGRSRAGSMDPAAFGIFGLVADRSLEKDDHNEIVHDLLYRSIGQAAVQSAVLINIVIHNNDHIVLANALNLGFEPVGRRGNAAGAHGLKQQRYQRPVDLSSVA